MLDRSRRRSRLEDDTLDGDEPLDSEEEFLRAREVFSRRAQTVLRATRSVPALALIALVLSLASGV
jgi:hypothetical protein